MPSWPENINFVQKTKLLTAHIIPVSDISLPRPHSSQSACVRPSRLYRHSAHLAHRLSLASSHGPAAPLASGRLKPVAIPLSPNCDINHNKEAADTRRGAERFRFSPAADNTSILSPTGSTVSSLLSIPVFPGYRCDPDHNYNSIPNNSSIIQESPV